MSIGKRKDKDKSVLDSNKTKRNMRNEKKTRTRATTAQNTSTVVAPLDSARTTVQAR